MYFWLFFVLLFADFIYCLEVCESQECESKDEIVLRELEDESVWSERKKIFFIETSDKGFLTARQSCSVESLVVTNPDVSALVILTTKVLRLNVDNSTRMLFERYNEKNVFFRYVNKETIFDGTPLEEIARRGLFEERQEYKVVQYRYATNITRYRL